MTLHAGMMTPMQIEAIQHDNEMLRDEIAMLRAFNAGAKADPHTYEAARVLRAVPLDILRRMPPILGPKGDDERPALCDDPVTLRLALAQARAEIARLLDKYEPAGGEADEAFDHLVERRRKAEGGDLQTDDGDPYDPPPASLAWLLVAVVAAWGIVGGLGWLGVQVWSAL